jgi:AraC-like DNA-binding protein
MLFEPTTLAASASALIEAVQLYGCDAQALFRRAGLDMEAVLRPGARYPFSATIRLWRQARKETGDPCLGLTVGQKLRPPAMHALGLSWLSSPTLLEGLHRIDRYAHVANTSLKFHLVEADDQVKFAREPNTSDLQPTDEAVDAGSATIITICRSMSNQHFAPLLVTFVHADNGHLDQYVDFFRAPVKFSASEDALYFDAEALRERLPAGNRELAYENDRITERYLATLNPDQVQDRVREILLTLLPSGDASQQTVAANLNRSVSALQRQLKSEGASYREILEDTRRTLAQQFIRENRYSLSQIAYLLGFSDQANFSRAFKRWTGTTPTDFARRRS